jgi:hypothetical protein
MVSNEHQNYRLEKLMPELLVFPSQLLHFLRQAFQLLQDQVHNARRFHLLVAERLIMLNTCITEKMKH